MAEEEKKPEEQEFGNAKAEYLKWCHNIQNGFGENESSWPPEILEERNRALLVLAKQQKKLKIPGPLLTIMDTINAVFPNAEEIDSKNEEDARQ